MIGANAKEQALVFIYEKDPTVDESIGLDGYVDIMVKKLGNVVL
jgi:hypothetical protein